MGRGLWRSGVSDEFDGGGMGWMMKRQYSESKSTG